MERGALVLIDQRKLPERTALVKAATLEEQVEAIRTLAVRGAPALGAFGACSLSLAIARGEDPEASRSLLLSSRPTAVDLGNCTEEVILAFERGGAEAALGASDAICQRIIEACRRIGEAGSPLIAEGSRTMTHCNAGALASLDWGTALSPIRSAARSGRRPFVWVSETRPLLQGARLTAWELSQEGIGHKVFSDAAAGHLMSRGSVDLVLVGADRVCRNGDVANKIGTYMKAVLAKEHTIPFYVAFPTTTLSPGTRSGDEVVIEERDGSEVLSLSGKRTAPESSEAVNPAFDITPERYITGYITEDGVFSPKELRDRYFSERP